MLIIDFEGEEKSLKICPIILCKPTLIKESWTHGELLLLAKTEKFTFIYSWLLKLCYNLQRSSMFKKYKVLVAKRMFYCSQSLTSIPRKRIRYFHYLSWTYCVSCERLIHSCLECACLDDADVLWPMGYGGNKPHVNKSLKEQSHRSKALSCAPAQQDDHNYYR
jgi:hypothetical protein